jgi:two-component system cell cycle response regulator
MSDPSRKLDHHANGAGAALPIEARLERLLERIEGAGSEGLLATATRGLVELFGDRGSCILLDDRPHIFVATDDPSVEGRTVDLELYPEITAALARGELVVVDDVRESALLRPVRERLPAHLGSVAVAPLIAAGHRYGALIARSQKPRIASEVERATGRLTSSITALLLAARRHGLDEPTPSPYLDLPAPVATITTVDRNATPIGGIWAAPAAARKILVIDEDAAHARELTHALTDEGYEVVLEANTADALARAREIDPALVVVGVHPPMLEGFEVARQLADDRRTAAVPVLFLSAMKDLPTHVRDCHVAVMDFLRRPYTIEELLVRVDRCLMLAEARDRLRRKARIDELTGLGNLRFFEERLAVETSRIARYGTALSMVVIDVDGLKIVNDKHGHPTGSAVLKAIGAAIGNEIRDTDLAARYGGDEFIVLLPHTQVGEGVAFAGRLLDRIRRLRPCGLTVSVSMGVAAFDAKADSTVQLLLERADAAAYRAKRQGGDRVAYDE